MSSESGGSSGPATTAGTGSDVTVTSAPSTGQVTLSSDTTTAVADESDSSTATTAGSSSDSGSGSPQTTTGSDSSSSTGPAVICEQDGVVGEGETCDDDNPFDDDGCTNCHIDDGWGCIYEPSVCMLLCDPLAQDCAMMGYACYPFDDGEYWGCYVDASAGIGEMGDPCEYPNVCDPGLACVGAEHFEFCDFEGCCTPLCDLDDPSCPIEWTCVSFYEGAPPMSYENVGICSFI
ncbi:MAG TPA: hypothetical protein VG755_39255 [Nannocystaceae bacterium]|nr:hypothetical protein [Nannocystaceae bacterium]